MSRIPYFNFSQSDLEEELSKAVDITISYILDNKMTLEDLKERQDKLAMIIRRKSFWKKIFNKDDEEFTLYIVEVQNP